MHRGGFAIKQKSTPQLADSAFGFLLSAPATLVLGLVLLYPLAYAFVISLWSRNLLRPEDTHPAGFGNYVGLLSDRGFLTALGNTAYFTVCAVGLELVLGMLLALMLARINRGRDFFRTLLITPIMLAPLVTGYLWRFLLSDQFGLINKLLVLAGIIRQPLLWLTNPRLAIWGLILADVWQTTPFMMLILFAGLVSLPLDLYEAADIDGANGWQKFARLTIPLLRPVILVALLTRTMDAFRIFGLVFVMTNGGPGKATDTLSLFIYRTGFQRFSLGDASASAFIMVGIMALAGALLIRILRTQR